MHLLQRDGAQGKRQGRYVLGDLLGRGGMAEVFAGQSMGSHGFQKPVAIKRLLPELATDSVFVERLIGEAKLLVGMQHGNIVSVLDLARDGDDVFLVMEFMDGPSVRQLLKARGAKGLPLGVATYIVQNAAAGLEFAHNRRDGAVIHADISPSNILLTTSGEVRVADFGIARREGNGAGVVEGKWAYMAPEQARGEALTPRSDVFALGVVLYELITGQHPLGRQITADERESAPLNVIPPRQVKPAIPVGLEKICMKALAHDPRDRYARMQTFIDAIVEERFANGWREGANDLAGVIRDVTPGAGGVSSGPKTQHTDRPLTIVTRSLISQPNNPALPVATAPRRPPSTPPVIVEESLAAPIMDSGAQTRMMPLEPPPPTPMPPQMQMPTATPPMAVPTAAPQAPTQMLQAGAQQAPSPAMIAAFAASMLPAPELASVHGGNTFTGASSSIATGGSNRWALGVLGAAALAGTIAAIVFGTHRSSSSTTEEEATPVVEKQQVQQPDPTPVTPPPQVAQQQVAPPPPVAQQQVTPPPPVAQQQVAPPPVTQDTAKNDPPKNDPPKNDPPKNDPPKNDPPKNDPKGDAKSLEARIAQGRNKTKAATPPVASNDAVKSSAKKGAAVLQVDAENAEYANIRINSESHDTPTAKFNLAAGTYKLVVSNETEKFTCHVTLDPGQVLHMHVSMEDRSCSE
ncbi:MAG: protein kinase [Kofleriaceae bacterium]